ncbi:restriction endonuclease subunit S [Bacteroides finegoldii]|uniref:restriction endonuclease subunit S n=1 Tax=Bacteroides finegoldii TaxID=338188 RepID=UPI00397DB466
MEEWKEYKIEDICEHIFAGGDAAKYSSSKYQTPFYNIPIYANSTENEGLYGYCDKAVVSSPAVTIAARGAGIGFVAFRNKPFVPIVRLITLITNNSVDTKFLYYYLKNRRLSGDGSAIPQITVPMVKKEVVTIPALEEQKRIADILSSFDAKIELNRRINDNLEQQAQALFKSWFVDFEPFNGEKPSNWSYCKIKNLHHIIETGKRPKGGVAHIKQGIPSIGAESIKGIGYYDYSKTKYISNEFASSLKKGKIHDYDLLIYKDGGKPGYFIPNFSIMGEGFPFDTMYLNEHVFRLDLGSSGMNIFAYFYFQTDEIINMLESVGGKAAIPGINQQNIEDLEILSPDIDYVQRYGELVYPIFKSILQNCRENAKLEKIRDALLPRLMSGELKIYDLNC